MQIRETSAFTKRIVALLGDEEYRLLQVFLLERPDAGAPIADTGGIRKLRWGFDARGKRGGIRVIYYWYRDDHELYMLVAYTKSEKDDLTDAEKRLLKKAVDLGLR